jgi:GTP cyclohydrolase II
LEYFKIQKIALLTNNPKKVDELKVTVEKRIPIIIEANQFNKDYLLTKKEKMNHFL